MAALGEAEGNDKNKASFLVKRSECEKEEDARRRVRILRAGSALHGGCIALKIEKQTAQHGAGTVLQARGGGARLGESGSRAEEREVHPMDRTVVALQSDHTHYAIAKTSGMCAAIRESYEVRMFGKNESTQRQQAGHWRRWVSFCGAQGICATREDHEANSGRDRVGYAREVELLNSALCFYMGIAKGRGRPAALPKTGMNWLRAIRRVHEQMMPRVDRIPMKAVEDCYNGLMRHYQLKWTVAATLPRRKEPLTNADIARLADLWWNPINSGKKLGRLTIEVGTLATTMIGCLWLLMRDWRSSHPTNGM
jgi:hypothetical protein